MKQLLLASASIIAFAGAASAEVTFGGTATLGYNDDDLPDVSDDNYGFYWDANVAVTLSQELDNGVTAAVTFDFDAADNDTGSVLDAGSYLLSLTADMGGLYYGDTAYAAQSYWKSAGDMEADDFSASDGEIVLRGELIYGGITAGVSYAVADGDGNQYDLDGDGVVEMEQLSVGATGAFGNFTFAVAYQEEAEGLAFAIEGADAPDDISDSEIFGISVGTSFAGADLTVAYAQETRTDDTQRTSTGVQVAYPFGPVTLTAYYVMEDIDGGYAFDEQERNYGVKAAYASGPIAATLDYQDDQGTTKIALDAAYDLGNGLSVLAGYYTEDSFNNPVDPEDEYYVAGSVDLGGGADFVIAYAEGGDDSDEIGSPEYERGITAELTLEF